MAGTKAHRLGTFVVAAAALLAVLAFAGLATLTTRPGASCAAMSGGDEGAEAQLRYVDVAERQVTFTFGPSSLSARFGVPRFAVQLMDPTPPAELDTGTRRLAVTFRGASGFNPDLTSSYAGASVLVPPEGTVREVRVTQDSGRELAWAVVLARLECPAVTTNSYVWGKSPRAQVTLTFGQDAWITVEHASTYVGSPILAPVLVTGVGFAPGSMLTLRVADQVVDTATADADGHIEKSFAVPKLQPGFYVLSVTDSRGRRASYRLMVTDEL